MSGTIYGGVTQNGVTIQDMIDDYRDYIFKNDNHRGYFARLCQRMEEGIVGHNTHKMEFGPAIGFFREDEPYEPLYARRLEGIFEDYIDFFFNDYSEKFMKELEVAWKDFASEYKEVTI